MVQPLCGTDMSAAISRLKKKCSANKNVVEGLLVKVKDLVLKDAKTDDDIEEIKAHTETIKEKRDGLKDTVEKILAVIPEEDEMVEESTLFEVKMSKAISITENFLAQ